MQQTDYIPNASYSLDHLGLVAGMFDELGLTTTIDSLIIQDQTQRHISVGIAVKAMVLNGLGFANRALYLTPHFFKNKPVERLLGTGITAEQLNDDTLGRALDAIYKYGIGRLYSQLALKAVSHLKLDCKAGHLDSSSFHVDGKYNSENEPEEGVIHITKGYSRDHRPDLNQVVLLLIAEAQAGIPILMSTISGNINDQVSFRETVDTHVEQLKADFGVQRIISDSALYNAKTLQTMGEFIWISRVPDTLGINKQLISELAADLSQMLTNQPYCQLGVVYADIKQRWLVIYSQSARHRVEKTLQRQHLKQTSKDYNAFNKLGKQAFACEAGATQALEIFKKSLSLTSINDSQIVAVAKYSGKGRPSKDQEPSHYCYYITGCLFSLPEVHNQQLLQKSCFILATNELDEQRLSNEQVIESYKKDQQKVEGGWRFLKDPLFMLSTLFLKSPKRIMALMMVMTLCLLVYAALQWRIRQALQTQSVSFPNQKGKLIDNPTARWVFQFFTGIHVVLIEQHQSIVLNLNKYHFLLLQALGKSYVALYENSG